MAENPKAYDQAFKSLSDTDPRGLLDIFGVLPHGVDAEVEPLPRDIAARPLVIDSGYFVRPSRGKAFIAVFEALTSWKAELGGRLASYGAALGDRYRMPVRVYPLPMAPHACPKRLPEYGRTKWGDVEVSVRLRWIKPWEIDAGIVLGHRSATLDPWAVLFQCSDVQTDEVLARLTRHPGDFGLFRILGGMRYRRDVSAWKELVTRIDSMITKEKMRDSLAVKEWLREGRREGRKEGRKEGRQEGRQEGELDGMRFALVACIEERFPLLNVKDDIQAVSSIDDLHSLFSTALKASSATAVSKAIQKFTKRAQ